MAPAVSSMRQCWSLTRGSLGKTKSPCDEPICSVVPRATPLAASVVRKLWGLDILELNAGTIRGVGVDYPKPVDYPDYAAKVAEAILDGRAYRGILICGSGVGASVAANKIKGIRAGLCHDGYSAHQGVEHDEMNVLVLGSLVIGPALAQDLVQLYLGAKFTQEKRHVRRLAKVAALEAHFCDPPKKKAKPAKK